MIKTRDIEQEKVMNNAEARDKYYEYVKKLLEKAKLEENQQNKDCSQSYIMEFPRFFLKVEIFFFFCLWVKKV